MSGDGSFTCSADRLVTYAQISCTVRRSRARRENHLMRVTVRVHPASKRSSVGGRYGDSDPPVLVVRVAAPATDGRANDAVLDAMAAAFRVPRRAVRLVSGMRSRTKVVEVQGADPAVLAALVEVPGS